MELEGTYKEGEDNGRGKEKLRKIQGVEERKRRWRWSGRDGGEELLAEPEETAEREKRGR